MSQQLPNLMESLSISNSSASRGPPSPGAAAGNRLPPLMKKYMKPGLVRPPNSGLANHHAEAQRAALLNLASATNMPAKSTGSGSPNGKPKHSLQHTAHGIHGPAHASAARTQASSIKGTTSSSSHPPAASASSSHKVDIGKYDGGFEADEAGKEAVTGEAAKLLEMDSGAANG